MSGGTQREYRIRTIFATSLPITPPPPVPGTAPGRVPWPSPRPPWRRGRRARPGTRPRPEAAGGRLWAPHGQRSRPWAWHWPGRRAGRPARDGKWKQQGTSWLTVERSSSRKPTQPPTQVDFDAVFGRKWPFGVGPEKRKSGIFPRKTAAFELVGERGFEPLTFWSRTACQACFTCSDCCTMFENVAVSLAFPLIPVFRRQHETPRNPTDAFPHNRPHNSHTGVAEHTRSCAQGHAN